MRMVAKTRSVFFVRLFSRTKHCLGVHRDGDGTNTARHDISCSATVFMGFLRSLYKVARSKSEGNHSTLGAVNFDT